MKMDAQQHRIKTLKEKEHSGGAREHGMGKDGNNKKNGSSIDHIMTGCKKKE